MITLFDALTFNLFTWLVSFFIRGEERWKRSLCIKENETYN